MAWRRPGDKPLSERIHSQNFNGYIIEISECISDFITHTFFYEYNYLAMMGLKLSEDERYEKDIYIMFC